MGKASEAILPFLTLEETAAASIGTPAADRKRLFVDTDGSLKFKDEAGAVTPIAGIPESLIDAKGDLLTGSAADTVGRLAVGTNGHVLTADSAEALGVKWAAGGGGGGDLPAHLETFSAEQYPETPNAADDEFDDGTGMSGATNGLDARWAWRNQGGATATFEKAGWLTLNCPAIASGSSLRIIEQAIADGTYEAKISAQSIFNLESHAGLVLVDDGDGSLLFFGLSWTGTRSMMGRHFTSVTAGSSNLFADSMGGMNIDGVYLRIVRSGTGLEFWWSHDGIGWFRRTTTTKTTTHIGLVVNEHGNNSGTAKLYCDYFRKVA